MQMIFFSKLSNEKKLTEKTNTSVSVIEVRDRKFRTALRTNQIVGFVTLPAWKKTNAFIIRLAPRAGKMNRISRSDWLHERVR